MKMKIKEIYVEVKKSVNYQTYTYGELVEIEEEDNVVYVRKHIQKQCREEVLKMMEEDKQKEEKELKLNL